MSRSASGSAPLRADLKDALQADWVVRVLGEADAGVLEMPRRVAPTPQRGAWRSVRRRWLPAGSVAAAVLLACIAWLVRHRTAVDPGTVATAVGEQRFMTLSDGSTIALNTDLLVDIRIGPASREIGLRRGEVLLDVAEDPARPFRVRSRDVTVEGGGNADRRVPTARGHAGGGGGRPCRDQLARTSQE